MKHFIVIVSFKVPIAAIGEHLLRQHLALLQKGYESGYILLYGPREPEEGTMVLARVESRRALKPALEVDPLVVSGIASYDFMEFIPVRFPVSLQGWVDPLRFQQRAIPGPEAPSSGSPSEPSIS